MVTLFYFPSLHSIVSFYCFIPLIYSPLQQQPVKKCLRYGWQSISSVPDFLTHRCPSFPAKRHLLKQTEILRHICNDCSRHLRIFFDRLLLQYGVAGNPFHLCRMCYFI